MTVDTTTRTASNGFTPSTDAVIADPRLVRETGRHADADRAGERASAELRDVLSDVGTVVVAATAGISSWAGWVSLGRSVGWRSVGLVDLAWLLPVSVDVYAFVALRTWHNARLPESTRRVGKWSAIGALTLSIAGNATGHAIEAGVFQPGWYVVVLVAALAPILLFLILHLRVLRTRDQAAAARSARERAERKAARAAEQMDGRTRPRPVESPGRATRPGGSADQAARPVAATGKDDELVARLRELDARHGSEIGRDAIVRELGVGSGRAKRLRDLARTRSTVGSEA